MRALTYCIAAVTLVASICPFSCATHAEELQWVQALPNQPSRQTVARPTTTRQSVQPTFRQPQQFKQPSSARHISAARRSVQPKQPSARRIAERTRVGIVPTQHTEAEELPTAATPKQPTKIEYQPPRTSNTPSTTNSAPMMSNGQMMSSQSMMMEHGMHGEVYGETYHGMPEPTCGCVGPCGCGDSCFLGEPGCCAGDVCFGEATCAAGCCDPCGDACCGDGCCDPGCCDPGCGCAPGCGDVCYENCSDCITWPQALFGFESRGCTPILWIPPIKEFTAFAGVQGHKGPLDAGRDRGNFGFHQGFNLGGKMAWIPWRGLGYQVGYRVTQNQLQGDSQSGTNSSHTQQFFTTGLFYRNCYGWRYGLVWDLLRDRRQQASDYGQVRGQIGWRNCHNREFGFQFASHSKDSMNNGNLYRATEQYRLYYQIFGHQGGDAKAFIGLTGQSEGLLGTEFTVPVSHRFSLAGTWTYLIPDNGNRGSASEDEAWNVGMSLVWHYGCRAKGYSNRPYAPMFDVADNGSMIIKR